MFTFQLNSWEVLPSAAIRTSCHHYPSKSSSIDHTQNKLIGGTRYRVKATSTDHTQKQSMALSTIDTHIRSQSQAASIRRHLAQPKLDQLLARRPRLATPLLNFLLVFISFFSAILLALFLSFIVLAFFSFTSAIVHVFCIFISCIFFAQAVEFERRHRVRAHAPLAILQGFHHSFRIRRPRDVRARQQL